MYIDTHCHIDYILQKTKQASFEEFVARTRFPANYGGCISIFCDPGALSPSFSTWVEQLSIPNVWGAFGIHPHNAKYYTDKVEERIIECLNHPKAVAWGECGLDFHYNHSPPDQQITVFARQALQSVLLAKPLVVHSRNAEKETAQVLREHLPPDHRVHLHCFNESREYATALIHDFPNLFIGISGTITFGDAGRLRDLVRDVIPLDRILLETDSPYLTPKSGEGGKKGGRGAPINHPGYVPVIAEAIAQLKGVPVENVFAQTRENTTRCFGI